MTCVTKILRIFEIIKDNFVRIKINILITFTGDKNQTGKLNILEMMN